MIDVTSFILAILLAICVFTIFRFNKALKTAQKPATTQISTEISQLKSIGELSVFQVYSKEIVTKTDHAFGTFGKEYLRWLVSEKKLSMIFEFEINFIYDLTSPPDSLNGFFGSSFSEEDKNRLIEEARAEVEKMSVRLINQLQSKIHKSARDTLEAIAKSFGARAVRFEFNDEGEQVKLNLQNVA